MTRMSFVAAALLLCLSGGCGRHAAAVDGATNVDPTGQDAPSFNLRIAGDDPGDIASALMRVRSVQVTSAGAVLAHAVETPEVELARMGHSFLLSRFQVPPGVEDVEFVVAFEGGVVQSGAASFEVDSRCQTLRIAGKVSRIAERKHAVIHVDLARSFVRSGASMLLVPHFQLQY